MEQENKDISTQEVKEEQTPVEESTQQDKKVENKQPQQKKRDPIKLEPFSENEESYDKVIEGKRVELYSAWKKERNISRISMIVAVGLVVGSVVLIAQQLTVPGYILAGVTLLGLVVYYFLTKNKFPSLTKEYISKFSEIISRKIYVNKPLSEMVFYPDEKLDLNTTLADKVFKTQNEIVSRNLVKGKLGESNISITDIALYAPGDKKGSKSVVFLGKYINYVNKLHFEGRYILSLKGPSEKPIDQPNDIEDLEVLCQEDNFTVYGPKDSNYTKVLGSKFISKIKALNLEKTFMNFSVVVWAGYTAAYLSFDDSIMSIPFEHNFNAEPFETCISSLNDVYTAIKEIN